MSKKIPVGAYKGFPISYNSDAKKFEVTIEVKGVKRTLRTSSEIALRKQVDKVLQEPLIEAIEISTWRDVFKPIRKQVAISGNRLYEIQADGKKRRTDFYNMRKFDEEVFNEMMQIYSEYEKLCDRMDKAKNKLKKIT